MSTCAPPNRREVRLLSVATLPPPMTATRRPTLMLESGVLTLPCVAARRKVGLSTTLGKSSPGMPSLSPPCAPMPIKTVSKPCSSRSAIFSMRVLKRNSTPSFSTSATSLSMTCKGIR